MDAKTLGERVDHNKKWDNMKIGMIKCIVKQKFVENNDLKLKLLGTAGYTLEEATFDKYWGTGVPVYSKEFKRGRHTGKNIMGRLLEEIRDDFLAKNRGNTTEGLTTPHRTPHRTPTPTQTTPTHTTPATERVPTPPAPKTRAATLQQEKQEQEKRAEQTDTASKDGNHSTTSHYLDGMSESVLKNMLLGLKNTNTGLDVQEQILLRLEEISAMNTAK